MDGQPDCRLRGMAGEGVGYFYPHDYRALSVLVKIVVFFVPVSKISYYIGIRP